MTRDEAIRLGLLNKDMWRLPMNDGDQILAIRQAIRNYYYALDMREHGGSAECKALETIERILSMSWEQGEEKRLRSVQA